MYKKNENGGILPDNFVLTPNKSCWEKSREKLIDAEKKVENIRKQLEDALEEVAELSSINAEQYKTSKKKIKRTQYDEGYMVYILQEKYHKEAGIYKIGKSKKNHR